MNIINKAFDRATISLNNNKESLISFCNKDPYVKEFIEEVLKKDNINEVYPIKKFLIGFAKELGFNINSFYSIGAFSELAGFIGNYFYDDSYFTVEELKINYWNKAFIIKIVKPCSDCDCLGSQSAKLLLDAAKHNKQEYIKMHKHVSGCFPGEEE